MPDVPQVQGGGAARNYFNIFSFRFFRNDFRKVYISASDA